MTPEELEAGNLAAAELMDAATKVADAAWHLVDARLDHSACTADRLAQQLRVLARQLAHGLADQ